MGTTSIRLAYRPVIAAALVKQNDLNAFIQAIKTNVCLWGGIFNPIIPYDESIDNACYLIDIFHPDVIYSQTPDNSALQLIKKYDYFSDPNHYENVITFNTYPGNKQVFAYADVANIISYYWDRDFKHDQAKEKSNCRLLSVENTNPLYNLLLVNFGQYHSNTQLSIDFADAYTTGLSAKVIKIDETKNIPKEFATAFHPITLTKAFIIRPVPNELFPGIFIGDANSFDDLITFWNLRSSGIDLLFVPFNECKRFADCIAEYLSFYRSHKNLKSDNPESIGAYYCNISDLSLKEALNRLEEFKVKFRIYSSKNVISRIKFEMPSCEHTTILANTEEQDGTHYVSISIPKTPFSEYKHLDSEHQVVALNLEAYSDFSYKGSTLSPPNFSKLNNFLSRKISILEQDIRTQPNGLSLLLRQEESTLALRSVQIHQLIIEFFKCIEIKADRSQAGLFTERIVESIGWIDRCRVFKISGVRNLIKMLDNESSIKRGEAERIILNDDEFDIHKHLYIEPREKKELAPKDAFDFLLKKNIFRPGLQFKCKNCNLHNWITLKQLDDTWVCPYCGFTDKTSMYLRGQGDWMYRKSGLFSKNNNQEGAIPVILTLMQLNRIVHSGQFHYTYSLNVQAEGINNEIDFAVLHTNSFNGQLNVLIGECKSDGGIITKVCVDTLLNVRKLIVRNNIGCYLVFSKTSTSFLPEEIELFNYVDSETKDFILFTSKELEPYAPYDNYKREEKLYNSAHNFAHAAANSRHIYLKKPQEPIRLI